MNLDSKLNVYSIEVRGDVSWRCITYNRSGTDIKEESVQIEKHSYTWAHTRSTSTTSITLLSFNYGRDIMHIF